MTFSKKLVVLSLVISQSTSFASYPVKKGDSLSQIAKEKYGDILKWKDLWKLNQELVANPDLIYPGQRLRLLESEKLDLYAANSAADSEAYGHFDGMPNSSVIRKRHAKKSTEWELLPQQNWERFIFKEDPAIDPDGFDRRSKVTVRVAEKTAAQFTIAPDRIPILGEVSSARSEYDRLYLGEQIFIKADEAVQVGTTYSVTDGPQKVVSDRDRRVGFVYDIAGKVRIIGVRDGLFIGTITALYLPIKRKQLLIPEVKDYSFPAPVAAESALRASIIVPESQETSLLAEQQVVILDAGTDDGVKNGLIFRHFLHEDPATGSAISSKDFLIDTELQVIDVQKKFSIAIILRSRNVTKANDEVIALTDLKDFETGQGLQTTILDPEAAPTVDSLDKLDNSEGLGEKENKDLRQLEKWSKPRPESTLLPAEGQPSEDIQTEDVHSNSKKPTDIGDEPAPNDGSDKLPVPSAPETPDTSPASPPATAPDTTTPESPPAATDAPPASIESTTTPPDAPPPVLDATPAPPSP